MRVGLRMFLPDIRPSTGVLVGYNPFHTFISRLAECSTKSDVVPLRELPADKVPFCCHSRLSFRPADIEIDHLLVPRATANFSTVVMSAEISQLPLNPYVLTVSAGFPPVTKS